MKVFLGGSKTLGALPRTVIERLTECIVERCTFFVGDCHGAVLPFKNFYMTAKLKMFSSIVAEARPVLTLAVGGSSPCTTIRIPDINFMQSRI